MTWILTIIFGITWAGPAGRTESVFPSEESCYRALRELKISKADDKRDTIAYCKPSGVAR